MKCFQLRRLEDETGVSGTGIVAEGVEFDNGKVALTWLANPLLTSVAIYDRLDDVILIHGHGGKTTVEIIGGGQISTSVPCQHDWRPDKEDSYYMTCEKCGDTDEPE